MQWHCSKPGGEGDADALDQTELRDPGLNQKPDLDEYR